MTLARFGQREDLCTLRDRAAMLTRMATGDLYPCADKWALFAQLRVARADYGLTDRDLTVLHALLSFHPDRGLDPARSLVVFPSNARLSDRAHGMAESTLRRHLVALTAAGLLLRRDSPNGKRYARRTPGTDGPRDAYGFDLRPLLLLADDIAERAEATRQAVEARTQRRGALVLRLRDLEAIAIAAGNDCADAFAHLRKLLRRTMTDALLDQIETALTVIATALSPALLSPVLETAETGGSAVHSDRHIQNQDIDSLEEPATAANAAPIDPSPFAEKSGGDAAITLPQLLSACPEAAGFAEAPLRHWRDVTHLADRLFPHLGISPQLWGDTCRTMGREAAAAVLCLLMQRMGQLRSLPAYLASLTMRAKGGSLSLPAVLAWAGRAQLTAVNSGFARC